MCHWILKLDEKLAKIKKMISFAMNKNCSFGFLVVLCSLVYNLSTNVSIE